MSNSAFSPPESCILPSILSLKVLQRCYFEKWCKPCCLLVQIHFLSFCHQMNKDGRWNATYALFFLHLLACLWIHQFTIFNPFDTVSTASHGSSKSSLYILLTKFSFSVINWIISDLSTVQFLHCRSHWTTVPLYPYPLLPCHRIIE